MKIINIGKVNLSFRSYEHREYALEQLRRQKEQEERKRQEEERIAKEISALKNELCEFSKYKGLTEPLCDEMASVILNFTCSMMMESRHDLREFFGSEKEAKNIRTNLSPECQQLSAELRESIKQTQISSDPIFGLITVNRLKDYMPAEGILTKEQYNSITENSKFACTTLINNTDLQDFDDEEKATIMELVRIVENTNGLNFGDNYDRKLQHLIDKANKKYRKKLNNSEFTKTFIPPVTVRYRDKEIEIPKEKERELNR